MHIYSAKVKLGGKLTNEVRLTDLTAAEILVLKASHGHDAVTEIVQTGTSKRSDKKERERLIGSNGDSIPRYREDQYRVVFATDFTPLPQVLPDESVDEDEDEEVEDEPDDGIVPVDEAIKVKSYPGLEKAREAMKAKKALVEAALA